VGVNDVLLVVLSQLFVTALFASAFIEQLSGLRQRGGGGGAQAPVVRHDRRVRLPHQRRYLNHHLLRLDQEPAQETPRGARVLQCLLRSAPNCRSSTLRLCVMRPAVNF